MVELSYQNLAILIVLTGVVSAALTLLVMHFAFKYHIGPEIERKVDRRLKQGAAQLEDRIRRRFLEVLTGKSDILRERARDLAKSGIGLLAGRRPLRDDYDDESDF